MIRTSAVLVAFVAVLGAIGYAQTMHRFGAATYKSPRTLAGQVNSDGSVSQGSHFDVVHVGTGEYELTFSERYFPSGCSILTITAISFSSSPFVQQLRCNVYDVYFRGFNGKFVDSEFNLIAVAAE